MVDWIYVHIDTISNSVLTQGITAKDFHQEIIHQPKNLLLLNPSNELGEFETNTALKIIRGSEAVENYFRSMDKKQTVNENKWIDFTDPLMLKELTPLEISELLYFGHMKTHLHSPFFYKLQNNFAYFDLEDEIARIYYRYLDEFYRVLAGKITQNMFSQINKKRFFHRPIVVDKVPIDTMKSLKELMREGITFSFSQAIVDNKTYQIPIFLVGDILFRMSTPPFKKEIRVGSLDYDCERKEWFLHLEDDSMPLSPLTSSY
ncbi:MAG TPA: hypothetical protein H9829_06325 [Candidatus Tetragenococcus pullicola]|nr:hypothetical protein [Candidatus Tetragenococcus pullicola]